MGIESARHWWSAQTRSGGYGTFPRRFWWVVQSVSCLRRARREITSRLFFFVAVRWKSHDRFSCIQIVSGLLENRWGRWFRSRVRRRMQLRQREIEESRSVQRSNKNQNRKKSIEMGQFADHDGWFVMESFSPVVLHANRSVSPM